jgi:hypothetical protein
VDKKPNHMWRMAFVDYEGSTAQCLTCKDYFPASYNSVYKYCPSCGIELKKEFTKKNKRWGWFPFKRHFPVIECWCLVDRYIEEDTGFFLFRKKEKLTQVWEQRGSVLIAFNGFAFRKNLLQLVNANSKVVDSPTKMKLVVKYWDNKERTIYGSQFKPVFNREYHKIDPPKPYTLTCSGLLPSYYNQSKIMTDVFMTQLRSK